MFGRRKPTILNTDPNLSDDTQQNIILAALEIVNTVKSLLANMTPAERDDAGKWLKETGMRLVSKMMGEFLRSGGDMEGVDVMTPLTALAAQSSFLQRFIAAFTSKGENGPS